MTGCLGNPWRTFRPRKKYLAPPPRPRDTLPAPVRITPPPLFENPAFLFPNTSTHPPFASNSSPFPRPPKQRKIKTYPKRPPRILAFLVFLVFCFRYPIFLVFLCVCPSSSKDFRGSAKRKPLLFAGFPCFFPKKQGLEGQGPQIATCKPQSQN